MRPSPPPRARPPESTPGPAKNFGPGLSKPPGPFVADAGTRQRTGAEPKGQERIMTATYTWDVFSSLDGYGSHNVDWAATGVGKAPSCSIAASPCTTPSSGWSSG